MRWHLGMLLAAPLIFVSAADARMLRCRGDLVFEDSMARRVTLLVDPDEGFVKNPACHKYPELRGLCAGVITKAKDHDFLFGTTLSGYMLSASQLRSAAVACEADQVISHQRHRPPRAFLPRGVGRRVHNDLTHDSPARMMRIAARDKKSRERLCHLVRPGSGRVAVEVSQCGPDATPVINRSGELPRSRPRLA